MSYTVAMFARNPVSVLRVARRTPFVRAYASGHGPSYNEPSGASKLTRISVWRKGTTCANPQPPAPGTKRVKDSWEDLWYYGFYGSIIAAGVLYYFKPDHSVRDWARPEAEKRLDESGREWRYKPTPYSGYPNGIP